MKFRIKQRVFSFTESFDIEDQDGQPAYSVKGKLFTVSSSQTLYDYQGHSLLTIKRKLFSFMPSCRIIINDGSEWLVKKKFWPFWSSRFSIETPMGDMDMSGNIWDHEYEINHNGITVANISKRLLSWSDSYGVFIQDPKWIPQLLAVVIVIDRIHHPGKKAKAREK